jgi:SAM-dependent methyltransferase
VPLEPDALVLLLGGAEARALLPEAGSGSPRLYQLADPASGIQAREGAVRVVATLRSGLPFASGSFDAVAVSPLVSTTLNPRALVREIARVLKPGGRLFAKACCVSGAVAEDFAFTRVAADEGVTLLDCRGVVGLLEASELCSVGLRGLVTVSLADPEDLRLLPNAEGFRAASNAFAALGYDVGAVTLALTSLEAVSRGEGA